MDKTAGMGLRWEFDGEVGFKVDVPTGSVRCQFRMGPSGMIRLTRESTVVYVLPMFFALSRPSNCAVTILLRNIHYSP